MHIRIATWNVKRPTVNGWKRPKRNPISNQQLQDINADIWILTETHRVITPGDEYENLSTDKAEFHREGETRATIWSRWPIQSPLNTIGAITSIYILMRRFGLRQLNLSDGKYHCSLH